MQTSFSFVVPVYNSEKTLEQTLASIEKQTYKIFDVIVVDNNSTDNSFAIAQKFPKVKILKEKNQGRSYARNAGVNSATGEYVCFIDSDVILEETWLEEAKKSLEETPVDILATSITPAYETADNLLDDYRYSFGNFKSDGSFLSLQKFFGVLPVVNSAACVIKISSFREAGGFDETLKRDEDLQLSLCMYHLGMIVGGTMKARSQVRYVAKYRTLSYLLRNVERFGLSFSSDKPFSKVYVSLCKHFYAQRKFRLIYLQSLLEAANATGFLMRPFRRKRSASMNWKIDRTRISFRFSFIHQGRFYRLTPGLTPIFIDRDIYLLNPVFQSRKLPDIDSEIVRKIFSGKRYEEKEILHVIEQGLFHHA